MKLSRSRNWIADDYSSTRTDGWLLLYSNTWKWTPHLLQLPFAILLHDNNPLYASNGSLLRYILKHLRS